MVRLDAASLVPYANYQVHFKLAVGVAWENWTGGLFSPAGATGSQYLYNSKCRFLVYHPALACRKSRWTAASARLSDAEVSLMAWPFLAASMDATRSKPRGIAVTPIM